MSQDLVTGWTGAHAQALRLAVRMTLREFAAHLGVAQRTVSQWENRGSSIRPRPEMQAALDVALVQAGSDDQGRFRLLTADLGGGGEDPTNRRQLIQAGLGAAAMAVLSPDGSGSGEGVVPASDDLDQWLTVVPRAYRRVEAVTRSDRLVRPVVAHLRLLRHLAADAASEPARTSLVAALSETAGLAAWLYTDLDDRAAARRHYRLAITAAEGTGQPLLAAYMQGSYGQFATAAGDARQALALIAAARKRAASWPPIADVWFDVLTAGALAGTRDHAALAVLDRADTRLARAAAVEPVWPWVYPFDEIKLASYRAEIATRLGRADDADDAFRIADRVPRAAKQAAVAAVHRATASAAAGDVERACALAVGALDTAARVGSHRGVHAVARFRATLPAGAADHARALDERLDAVYAGAS